MKKTLKLALCGLMLAGATNAQVATLPTDYYDGDIGILPKSFSTDGKVKLLAAEELGEGGNIKIRTYNNSFNIEHSFEVVPQRLLNKKVTERRAIVATPGELVTLIDVEKDPSQGYWSQMSQEEKIGWLRSEGKYLLWDFGYNIDFRRDSIYTDANGDVYMYLINSVYDYDFGKEEERTVGAFVLNDETLKFQPITCSRTGEWEVVETEEYEYTNGMTVIWNVINMDSDWSYELELPLLATQTLFNADAKYEYIRYKRVAYSNRAEGDERDTDGDSITDVRSFRSGHDNAGIEVVSEDGNVIASFDAGDTEGATLILWGGKRYLGFYVHDEDYNWSFHIYEINPNGNSITRVSSEAFMHILPAMPRKNTSVTVEFGEESVKNGGQLMITDMNGRTVYRNSVASGETSVRVPLRRMASGIYNVTLVNGGKKVENSKLIVR